LNELTVELIRKNEDLQQRATELETLTEISETLRTALSVDEMLPDLLKKTAAAFGASLGSIYLLDQETGDLVANTCLPPAPGIPGHRQRFSNELAGKMTTSGKVYVTENVAEEPWNSLLSFESGSTHPVRTGLSLPLRTNQHVVGVMHLGLPESANITSERINLATAIADMAASAIWRASLFRRQTPFRPPPCLEESRSDDHLNPGSSLYSGCIIGTGYRSTSCRCSYSPFAVSLHPNP
jgi:transcriptional regulator with GAF, ATPase, and Fis domain